MSDEAGLAALVVYFRPCRVCGELIGTLFHDRAPICQDCAAKQAEALEDDDPSGATAILQTCLDRL